MLGSSSTTSTLGAPVMLFSPFGHLPFTRCQSNQSRRTQMTATVKHIALGVGAGILALGVSAGVFVHAQDQNTNEPRHGFMGRGMGHGGPGGPMGMLPMLGRQLDLTDAQKAQVKTIADSHKEDWK